MLSWETMLPAVVVLTLALVGGLWASIALRRRAPVEPMRDVLDDAEERVARLLAHLRELSAQKGRIDAGTYAKELADLEDRAAQALRERDLLLAQRPAASGPLPAAVAPPGILRFLRERPVLRGALWAICVFVVGGLLVYSILHSPAPAAPPSQAAAEPAQQRIEMPVLIAAETPTDEEVQALMERLKQNPHDVAVTVRLGHLFLAARMFEEAKILTDRALQLDAHNGEALAHAAALRSVQNREGGLADLATLLKAEFILAEAWLFRGMIGLASGDMTLMHDSFKHYLEVAPAGPERDHVSAMLNRRQGAPSAADSPPPSSPSP